MSERPIQPGYTRRDTGFPSAVFPGWFVEPEEIAEQQRRADRPVRTRTVVKLREAAAKTPAKRGPKVKGTAICKRCRAVFPTEAPQMIRRCPDCREKRGKKAS